MEARGVFEKEVESFQNQELTSQRKVGSLAKRLEDSTVACAVMHEELNAGELEDERRTAALTMQINAGEQHLKVECAKREINRWRHTEEIKHAKRAAAAGLEEFAHHCASELHQQLKEESI